MQRTISLNVNELVLSRFSSHIYNAQHIYINNVLPLVKNIIREFPPLSEACTISRSSILNDVVQIFFTPAIFSSLWRWSFARNEWLVVYIPNVTAILLICILISFEWPLLEGKHFSAALCFRDFHAAIVFHFLSITSTGVLFFRKANRRSGPRSLMGWLFPIPISCWGIFFPLFCFPMHPILAERWWCRFEDDFLAAVENLILFFSFPCELS